MIVRRDSVRVATNAPVAKYVANSKNAAYKNGVITRSGMSESRLIGEVCYDIYDVYYNVYTGEILDTVYIGRECYGGSSGSGGGDTGGGGNTGGGSTGDTPCRACGTTGPTHTTTIIPNSLPPCVGGNLAALQRLNGNDIGGLFQFLGNTTRYTWLIQTGNIPNDNGMQVNAYTSQANGMPADYISTTLNLNFTNNATDVAISRTLIHESMHAYMMLWGYSQGMNVNVTTSQLIDAYLGTSYPNDINGQHDAMSNIVDQMSQALLALYPNISFSYAQNLFWAGLTGTGAYAALSSAQKAAITAANTAEIQSQSSALGTKACN